MSTDFDSGCGGSYATLEDDGRVLLDGQYYSKPWSTSPLGAYQGESPSPRDIPALRDLVWKHASDNGLPASLVAGILYAESHGQVNAMNYADHPPGAGLMQVTSSGAKQGYDDWTIAHDADLAIRLGCEFFAKHCFVPNGGNYVKALATYNAGGVYCDPGKNRWNVRTTGDYVSGVLIAQNYAIDSGYFDPSNPPVPPPGPGPGPGPEQVAAAVARPGFPAVAGLVLVAAAGAIAYFWSER